MALVPVRFANFGIAACLLVACFDIASGLEHWPFGSYAMYSLLYADQLDWLRLYGVTDEGEVPLRGEHDFAPFDEARLVMALQRLGSAPEGKRKIEAALQSLLRQYNRRGTRAHLRYLRLYDVRWVLLPGSKDFASPRSRTLIAQVSGY